MQCGVFSAALIALCLSPLRVDSSLVANILMPGYRPQVNDAYVCSAQSVSSVFNTSSDSTQLWLTGFQAQSDANTAHHMLLFLCDDVSPTAANSPFWDCGHHGVCASSRIMFGWAKNAPATVLPDQVGFKVGGTGAGKYLVLQVHYAHPLEKRDFSGFQITYTEQRQKYQAGIYLLLSGGFIPADTPVTHLDVNCPLSGDQPIYPFAFRAHAHSLGVVITAYRYNFQNHTLAEFARGNPQWPQAFYPVDYHLSVRPGDLLHARCTYNSTGRHRITYIGSTGADEMCNMYVMYYTDAEHGHSWDMCTLQQRPDLTARLPADSDKPLPPNATLESSAKGAIQHAAANATAQKQREDELMQGTADEKIYRSFVKLIDPSLYDQQPRLGKAAATLSAAAPVRFAADWAGSSVPLGSQVSAVSTTSDGRQVVVFHRGERVWHGGTFTHDDRLTDQRAVITQPTIVYLDVKTGAVRHQFGSNFFYMPHGLTVDYEDNIWCTDVGMHQVFKFAPLGGSGTPLLSLGERFVPGADQRHFCKPTAVAVLNDGSGEFFVADGYCNSRVLKFSADGSTVLASVGRASSAFAVFGSMLGRSPAVDRFNVPHALTLTSDNRLVCVADRENGRISCFTSDSLTSANISLAWRDSRIFALAYSPLAPSGVKADKLGGGVLYVVNGPNASNNKIQGYVVGLNSGRVVGTFSPNNIGLSNPHDVAATRDGSAIFVAELSPAKVWKFVTAPDQQIDKVGNLPVASAVQPQVWPNRGGFFGGRLLLAALFTVPLIMFIIGMLARRRRRKRRERGGQYMSVASGRSGSCRTRTPADRLGFEPVLNQAGYHDDSDSDVDEFSVRTHART